MIPFARILFPHAEDYGNLVARPEEISASIAWMLRRLAKTRPVLLLLDDVEWLDEASAALVRFLLNEFPAGSDAALAIVLVGSDKECLEKVGLDATQSAIELCCPTVAEQVQVLSGGVGLQPAVAEEVLTRIGAAGPAGAPPAASCGRSRLWPSWPGPGPSSAPRRDSPGPKGPGRRTSPSRPTCRPQSRSSGAGPPTIAPCWSAQACGCEGREFQAGVLADALGKSRLDMLVLLDEIERETGLIHEVRGRDDVCAFHSSLLVDLIRGDLGIPGRSSHATGVPHRVREYHARLAAALETSLTVSSGKLYDVANLFFAAGPRYAAKGVEYCLRAAGVSAASCDFRRARSYLDMAGQCAESSGLGPAVETQRQIIACQEAQVTLQGAERTRAAATGLDYLGRHADAPPRLVLAVAELCYDVGHRSRDRKWYDEATRLCRQVAGEEAQSLYQAQALHIMAVSRPADRHGERIADLRQAYQLVENAKPEDREAWQWFARILLSLAKELAKGTAQEQKEARGLFERRLRLEKEHGLGDLRGVAMALGGLGRLEWFAAPKDLPAAEQHFRADLEISEAIGDVVAQTKMHSLLGACSLEKDDIEPATIHYERSWQLAGDASDRCFAGTGLLRCHRQSAARDRFEAVARQLLELVRTDGPTIPGDCTGPLAAVLRSCPAEFQSDTVRSLLVAAPLSH